MRYYLLSGMNENNDYHFYLDIAKRFKEELKDISTIVYVPTYPDDKEKCLALAKSNIFEHIGVYFKKVIVLDDSYDVDDVKKILSDNVLVFLYGGNPYTQIDFMKKYKLKEFIKNHTIIGLSAGSINMCKKAICTKDADFDKSTMYDGLGFVDFSIEPHFNIDNIDVLNDLREFSKETDIYALEDSAYMIVDNGKLDFYRRYLFD